MSSERDSGYFVFLPELAGHGRGEAGEAGICVFDTWLGDDVVRAHPLLLVTAAVKRQAVFAQYAPASARGSGSERVDAQDE